MKKFLDVRGCSVIDSKGTAKGILEDCILDYKNKKICSYVVATKGIITSLYFMSLKSIIDYGDVIVSDEKLYKIRRHTAKKFRSLMAQGLIGKEVINERGQIIGSLVDLIFDEGSGIIKAIICSRGLIEDILGGRKLLMVNDKAVFEKGKIIIEDDDIEIVNDISLKKFTE